MTGLFTHFSVIKEVKVLSCSSQVKCLQTRLKQVLLVAEQFGVLSAFRHALTLRRLMLYIYMEHPFLMFLDHTQRRSTVGRTPLDE